MRALILDLLEYSHVSIGPRANHAVALESSFGSALMNLQACLQETNGSVRHDPLPTVMGDAIQLEQLFQNLLGNAIKYRGTEAPLVNVAVRRVNQDWQFAIKDRGIGFDMKYAQEIFEPFRRLHGRKEYQGTGIGLAICRRIVEGHRGKIWAESRPGDGSTFYFTLPVSGAK